MTVIILRALARNKRMTFVARLSFLHISGIGVAISERSFKTSGKNSRRLFYRISNIVPGVCAGCKVLIVMEV